MESKRKEKILFIHKIISIIIGSLMLSMATSFFYIPNGIISGGMSGLGILFNHLFGWNESNVITVASWSLFIIGWIVLGKKFALKTLCSTIVYPLGTYLFTFIFTQFESYLTMGGDTTGILVSAIFGGVLTGFGCGLTFLAGGSTGGVDIPALIMQKYTKVRVSYVSFSVDFAIILIGFIVSIVHQTPSALLITLIGIIAAFLQSFMMDRVFFGTKKSFIAYIISSKHEEINSFIVHELQRGATILNVEGGYSHIGLKMIKVCFDFNEYTALKDGLKKIDPTAFVSVVKAQEINGLGFENKSEIFDETQLDKWIKQNKENNK